MPSVVFAVNLVNSELPTNHAAVFQSGMKEIALRILQNALRSTRRINFANCADAPNVATAALMQQRCALKAPRLLATLRPPPANANAPNPPLPFPTREGGELSSRYRRKVREKLPSPARRGAGGEVNQGMKQS